jgi:16S rRNA (adenine1518-N6/adenine1519-N6)-dimethyltransferase
MRPKKQFGQNFLLDQTVIRNIISSVNIKTNDHILEIGPGQGALTKHLISLAKTLDVIEIDRDLITTLQEQQLKWGIFTIHSSDILKFDFTKLPADTYRVIGNLPYNISTPLLFYLAERITAVPNNKNYGRLSIMLQYHCKSELLFDVSPEAFYPKPKVTSSVIRMIPYSTPPIFCKNYALLEKIVATAFNQRRKTIHNSLKTYLSTENFVNLGLDPKLRAENCSLQNFVDMVNFLHSVNKPSK